MAGIGWKLEQMLERGTLGSTVQAYLTGVAVTSAPWLLTTAVLVTMRALVRGDAAYELREVERTITVVYAVTLVLSAPIHVVVSRFAADRLFERRLDLIAAPLRRALTSTIIAFLGVGVVTMLIIGAPAPVAVWGALLTAMVAAQWLLLSVGGGMSTPVGVLRAFATGVAVSILSALVLDRVAGLGGRGYLIGFTIGQGVALLGMLHQILRSLPRAESAETPGGLRRAASDYRVLALSAFAIQVSVWIDKIVIWATRGSSEAATLAHITALAWFVVVPAFAWIYVQVETAFYGAFRRYYHGLGAGASLAELEKSARAIRSEANHLVRGAATVQVVVTVLALIAAPHIIVALGLPEETTLALRLAIIGAAFQVVTLLGMLLLYYLDLRREALRVALIEVSAITITTALAAAGGGSAALGIAIGSIVPACFALVYVYRSVSTLVIDTFQSQPY